MKRKSNEWLKKLTEACTPITDKELKKVLEYVKWVKIRKVADDFEEIFSKYK